MDKLDIIISVMMAGYGLVLTLLYIIWGRIDKVDDKLTDIDRRVCRMEGALSSKDCCMLKDDRQLKKAE